MGCGMNTVRMGRGTRIGITAQLMGTSMLAALIAAPAAFAQDAPPEAQGEEREVIVVTAAKREQTLQEVPIAVSVVGGEVIDQARILDVNDLQTIVPSLRVTQLQSSANTNFVIRGFGNGANNAGIEPSVGVFIDGVYRSRSASAISDLPNVDRVEVLRGPQSTLFGKNASAGVISIVTAAPEYEFGAWGEASVGNFDFYQFRADVTGPITDKLAFRLYGSVNQRDGYFENLDDGEDFNDRDRWALRGQLLYEPLDNLSFRLIADYDEIDEVCCGVNNLVDGPTGDAVRLLGGELVSEDPFARQQHINFDSINEITNGGVSLQGDWDLDGFSVTSITAYRERTLFTDQDSDFTSADLIGRNDLDEDIDTFTQELRIASTGADNRFDWLIGGFYFDETVRNEGALTYGSDFRAYADILSGGGFTGVEPLLGVPAGTFGAEGLGEATRFGQDNTSWSVFGQIDLHVTDRLTLTGGLNYTMDEKDVFGQTTSTDVFSLLDFEAIGFGQLFSALTGGAAPTPENFAAFPEQAQLAQAGSTTQCSPDTAPLCNALLPLQPFQFLPAVTGFPNSVEDGQSKDDKLTWTARAAFDVTDNINVYFSAATGFKASSWNLSTNSRPFPGDFDEIVAQGLATPNLVAGTRFAGPEEALVYEIGMKAQFDTLAFNLTLFDQTLEGFQSNIFFGTGFVLANAGETSVQGVEFDATWDPIEELTLTAAVTYLDPVYDSFENAQGVNGVTDLSGERPAGIHEWSVALSATYTKELFDHIGFIRADYLHESEVQVVDNISEDVASREVNLVNMSAGIAPVNGFWELQLWARNLTQDDHLLTAFPAVAQAGSISGYPNAPRTFGATVRVTY